MMQSNQKSLPRTIFLFSAFILLLFTHLAHAQTWVRSLGQLSTGTKVISLQDGGFLITGFTYEYGSPGFNGIIIKTDSLGFMQWQHLVNGNSNETANGAVQTSNGNIYVISGYANYGSGNSSLVSKYLADGTLVWAQTLTGFPKIARDIETDGTNIFITGTINDSTSQKNDCFLTKLNSAGTQLWTKTYGDTIHESGACIKRLHDGGFFIGGNYSTTSGNANGAYCVKTNANGDTLWTKKLGYLTGSIDNLIACDELKGDSLIAITGVLDTYYDSYYVATLNMNGDTVRTNSILAGWNTVYDLVADNDGGFTISCSRSSSCRWLKYTVNCAEEVNIGYFPNAAFFGITRALDGELVLTGIIGDPDNTTLLLKVNGNIPYSSPLYVPVSPSNQVAWCRSDSLYLSVPSIFQHYQWRLHYQAGYNTVIDDIDNTDSAAFQPDSTGMYSCVMWNDDSPYFFSYTCSAIISQTPDTTITASGPLLHCALKDTISLLVKPKAGSSYKWFLNGAPLPGTSNKCFPLVTGNYSVSVSNACDSLTSAPIYVDVNTAPSVSIDTLQVNLLPFINAGTACNYYVFKATTSLPASYNWYLNGVPTGDTLVKDTAYTPGQYYVTAQNACGTNQSATATINYSTQLKTAGNLTGCNNKEIELIPPTGNYSYRWFKNGIMTNITIDTLQPGLISTANDSGWYKCRIIKMCNSIADTVFTDSLYYREHSASGYYVDIPSGFDFCTNSQVPLSINNNTGINAYQWYYNDTLIPGATQAIYNGTASGQYKCVLTFNCGLDTTNNRTVFFGSPGTSFYVTPNGASGICITSAGSSTVNLRVADSLGLFMGVTGYQWLYYNLPVGGGNSNFYNAQNIGFYSVAVSNVCGTDTTPSIFVPAYNVNTQLTAPAGTFFCADDSLLLSVAYNSSFTYQWIGPSPLPGPTANTCYATQPGYYYATISTGHCSVNSGYKIYATTSSGINNIFANQPLGFCGNDSVMLSANLRSDYSYQWLFNNTPVSGATQADYYALQPGSYRIRLTDSIGCPFISEPVTVSNTTLQQVSITAGNSPFPCTTDSVELAVLPQYATYQWSYTFTPITGATQNTFLADTSGYFEITVTDGAGCTGHDDLSVYINPALTFSVNSVVAAVCSKANGRIYFMASQPVNIDMTGPNGYTYHSGSYGTSAISNLESGWYYYTCTSSSGICVITDSVEVPELTQGTHFITTNPATPVCQGATVGLYGIYYGSPIQSLWSTGSTAGSINVNTAGTYSLTLTDTIAGCTVSDTIVITFKPKPQPNITVSGATTFCSGNAVQLDAGSGNWLYQWNNGAQTQTIPATASGKYIVSVTDTANQCSNTDTVTVNVLPIPQYTVLPANPVNVCFGQPVTLTATPGFTAYQWSTGDTLSTLYVTTSGNYSITVTNNYGCTTTSVTSVTQAPLLTASNIASNVSCNGLCNGSVNIQVNGGTPPYIYQWSNGNGMGLCPGNYSVTITDAIGCTTSGTATITEPPALAVNTVFTNPSCSSCCDGSATANVNGGTGSYFYLWNTGQTTATNTGLCNGIYTVTVTDANNCTQTTTVSFSTNINSSHDMAGVFIYPNPASSALFIQLPFLPGKTDYFEIENSMGQRILTGMLQNQKTETDISNLTNGVYMLKVYTKQGVILKKMVKQQ